MWEVLWKDDLVGVSPHSTGSLSGPRILYLMRPRMTGRTAWGITWTILLATIFHPLSPHVKFGRRIQEILKGVRGESERAREKEMKRRRERGTGALDSSNRQWQDNGSKNMSWCKVDIPHMGQTSTLVRESSLLPGLTPKMSPLQSLLHTERQV